MQGLSFYLFYVATISCVVTGIVLLRHRQLCRDSIYVQLLKIGVLTQFLCHDSNLLVLVAIMFLVLSAFLWRLGNSVATESCRHLT